jgi:hypothetical protein
LVVQEEEGVQATGSTLGNSDSITDVIKMPFSPYLPHVLYSLALTSVSINLVGKRKSVDDEKSRVEAQISILESLKEQLLSKTPPSVAEIERLKKLARPAGEDVATKPLPKEEETTWSTIFSGKGPSLKEGELSKWDQEDLEACTCLCFDISVFKLTRPHSAQRAFEVGEALQNSYSNLH